MNLPGGLFPAPLSWAALALFVALLGYALRGAPWERLSHGQQLHVFAGSVVACMLFWSIAGTVGRGLSFHLLGATIFTLMFGARLALLGLTICLTGVTLAGLSGWSAFGLNALLMVGIPVAVSAGVYRLVDSRLPNHFFVYVLAGAFLNGGLAMAANGLASTVVLWLSGVRPGTYLFTEYLPYYLLLAWGEALVTGMLMTILVVYRPAWVASFDDARYLVGR